jgi:hypothetical protein
MLRIGKRLGLCDMWESGVAKIASGFVAFFESEVPTLPYIASGQTTFALRAT